MRLRSGVARTLAGIVMATAVLLIIGWLAFVPSPREPGYQFVNAWGAHGTGPGEFRDPTGIAVGTDQVFVADSRNGRIQVFDLDGEFLREFGEPGEAPGQLGRPMNLAIVNGELYVPEYFNDRIQVFGLDGTLIVADGYANRIRTFGPDGEAQQSWGGPFGYGIRGPFNGWFAVVPGIATGLNGRVFATDFYHDRVQVFAPDGSFLMTFGGSGSGPGEFIHPFSIDTAPDGSVFVTDLLNQRVQKWRPAE